MIELSDWIENIFFARHETFAPRYGWLKKGYDAVILHGANVFDSPKAIEYLGVGKNMVRAMRFWCMAYHVIEPVIVKKPFRVGGQMQPSAFGQSLFDDEKGWDPFLEDIASLWLLHWQLFMPPVIATAWPIAMNLSLLGNFSAKDLSAAIVDRLIQQEEIKRYSPSSIEKDASCFVRMYGFSRSKNSDEIECPFSQLGLLLPGDSRQTFRFNTADKVTLPDSIFLASCFDFAAQTQPELKTLSLHKLVYGFNSPGVLFRISESEAGRRLEEGLKGISGVDFTESFGNRQLQFEDKPALIAEQFLRHYYTDKS
jgi:hypothetical protein